MLWIIIILIVLAVWIYVANSCLNLVVKPRIYTEEEIRTEEIEKGFSSAIEAYENKWQREDFLLDCGDVKISGEIITNPKADNKVAIICHGHTVNRFASLKYAELFYNEGFNVIIYDERHFGRSEGAFSTLGQNESKDLARIMKFTREKFSDDCRIVLHGESMGAATSLLALRYDRPELVIADCPFSDSKTLFGEWISKNMHVPPVLILTMMLPLARIRYDYRIKDTSPLEAVRNTDVPICFMHGDNDGLIRCEHSKVMYENCKNDLSELHLYPGADHARSIVNDPEKYKEDVRKFLKKVMS
ncbi:MAG: alpha/beta hydrolase [Erysipelotrichaceae bacterium]|nr:alpha/beta hydrolase [Erysipelotrichaceae bacterium]